MKTTFKTLTALLVLLATSSFAQNECIDSTKINPDAMCTMQYDPVCGCDNVTYSNACVATNSGVVSYIEGACSDAKNYGTVDFPECDTRQYFVAPQSSFSLTNGEMTCNFYAYDDNCNTKILSWSVSNDTIYLTRGGTKMLCEGTCGFAIDFVIPNLYADAYVIISSYGLDTLITATAFEPAEYTDWNFTNGTLEIKYGFPADCNSYNLSHYVSNDTIFLSLNGTDMACPDSVVFHDLYYTIDNLEYDVYYVEGILNTYVKNELIIDTIYPVNNCIISYEYWNDTLLITWPYANYDGCNTIGLAYDIVENKIDIKGLLSTMMYCDNVDPNYSWDYITTTIPNFTYDQLYITGMCQDVVTIDENSPEDSSFIDYPSWWQQCTFIDNVLYLEANLPLDCCNTHSLAYTVEGNVITTYIISTEMACIDNEVCFRDVALKIADLPLAAYYITGVLIDYVEKNTTTTINDVYAIGVAVRSNGNGIEITFNDSIRALNVNLADFMLIVGSQYLKNDVLLTITQVYVKDGDARTLVIETAETISTSAVVSVAYSGTGIEFENKTTLLANALLYTNASSITEHSPQTVTISPNPADSQINVASTKKIVSYRVFTADGKLLTSQTVGAKSTSITVDTLAIGIYTIEFTLADGKSETIRFIKK